jgi:hypothetical protein
MHYNRRVNLRLLDARNAVLSIGVASSFSLTICNPAPLSITHKLYLYLAIVGTAMFVNSCSPAYVSTETEYG